MVMRIVVLPTGRLSATLPRVTGLRANILVLT